MTDTERLAHNASVPADLAALVVLAANRLGVSTETFRGANQTRRFFHERCRIAVIARDHGFRYWAIGRALNRDHSTVMHAERKGRAG